MPFMITRFAAILTMASISAWTPVVQYANHPYVGTWKFVLPNHCTETYINRADGTHLGFSSDEVIESTFVISDKANDRGFYELVDTVTKSNGKRDCSGGTTPVGDKVRLLVRFNDSQDLMLVCLDVSMKACFGPSVRQRGSET
jgi:hypothetical protein